MFEFIKKVPSAPRKAFKRHFLVSVMIEARFQESLFALDGLSNLKSKLQNSLGSDFENVHDIFNVNFDVKSMTGTNHQIGLRAFSQKKGHELQIFPEKIVYVQQSYVGFEEFYKMFSKYIEFLYGIFGGKSKREVFAQIGLRKIDSISFEGNNLSDTLKHFRREIFSTSNTKFFNGPACRIHQNTIALEDGDESFILRSQCEKVNQNDYRVSLDFDLIKKAVPSEKLESTLRLINDKHFDLFSWAIEAPLRERLDK